MQLHETRMGQTLIERTMPAISKNLSRIAIALEKANELKENELGLIVKDASSKEPQFADEINILDNAFSELLEIVKEADGKKLDDETINKIINGAGKLRNDINRKINLGK